jgi:hypothetical protein
MDSESEPDALAKAVGHLAVGLVAVGVTKKVLRKGFFAVVMAGLLAVVVHAKFDAPVARRLSQLGL